MVYRAKFEGKLFSDPKCSGPLLQTLPLRELVKTILHARDPLFGGQGKEETMGLSSWVGGYMREHGSLKLGGGIYERTWVSQAGWGDI